jgi:hypothetical protein
VRQAGGHVLVQPRINGHDELGFFILDTGVLHILLPPELLCPLWSAQASLAGLA